MIYCRYCGTKNVDYGTFCSSCGKQLKVPPGIDSAPHQSPSAQQFENLDLDRSVAHPAPQPPRAAIRNYLVESIVVTICCFWPLGVPAIFFAAQVNSKITMGDFAGAQKFSNNARIFCIVSFVIGFVIQFAYTIFYGWMVFSEMSGTLN